MGDDELFGRFRDAWAGINAVYEQYARNAGVSYTLLQVLCEVHGAEEPMTQKDVCEACHLPKTTVNAIVTGLVRQGHAELREVPEDRRQKAIRLTDAGRAYATPLMEHMAAAERAAFALLDAEEARTMVAGVEQYRRNFDAALNQTDKGE